MPFVSTLSLDQAHLAAQAEAASRIKSFHALRARPSFVAAKEGKTASRRTRADAAHRSPALLAKQGTAPKLASLKQGASSALLGCGARRALRLSQMKQKQGQCNRNSASKRKKQPQNPPAPGRLK